VVESTAARRVAARGALSLSTLLPLLIFFGRGSQCARNRARSRNGICPPEEKSSSAIRAIRMTIVQCAEDSLVISRRELDRGPVGHLYL